MHAFTQKQFEEFMQGYIEAALWSSTCDTEESGDQSFLDENYDASDIAPESLRMEHEECMSFLEQNETDLRAFIAFGKGMSSAGHDFWLTRNGHGSGFWDRGIGNTGENLTKASKLFPEVSPYIGDDGKIYFG